MNSSQSHNPNWSATTKTFASVLIIGYLGLLILGPLTNPVSAPHVTTPLANAAAPIHQALFMGHGYRFFGPDPGASHSVRFTVRRDDGSTVQGHFPDRDQTSPRLLYHRWFMLSESLFREGANVPNHAEINEVKRQYQTRIDEYYLAGQLQLRKQLIVERDIELENIEIAKRRRNLLVRAIGRVLLERHQGQSIRLSLLERGLPTPEEVADHLQLDDPSLATEYPIGTFTRDDLLGDDVLIIEGDRELEQVRPLGFNPAYPDLEKGEPASGRVD
ncbi:MAG: hypothetical protein AAFN77_07080 [Planctomycetota bacterium]